MACFLSYSSADAEVASALYNHLTEAGESVFFAPRSQETRVMAGIASAIDSASHFIFLNSKDYIKSRFCAFEWSAFLTRCGQDSKLKIIGAQLDETTPPGLLQGWLYISRDSLGPNPASEPQWMDKILELVRLPGGADADEDARPGDEEIGLIANRTARCILEGRENADLLERPLLEFNFSHRVREGVIFLKPEGTFNHTCIQTIIEKLLKERINVIQARKYTGGFIKKHKLFDKHYFGPVTIARMKPPELDQQEMAKLHRYYFDDWKKYYGEEEEPSVDLIIPALCLLQRPYNLTSEAISELWERGRVPHLFWNGRADGLNKIGYQKSVMPIRDLRVDGGRARLLLNGYVPGYKKLLEEPSSEIRVVCLRVAADRDWDYIRDNILGGDSNPAKCKPGTLRRQAYENQAEFGISPEHVINGQQNLLHASATPLEGVYEINLWFNVDLVDTYLGAYLANRLGAAHLFDLFFQFHEFLNAARGKDIEDLVHEALENVPPPNQLPEIPDFAKFKDEVLSRYETLFGSQLAGGHSNVQAQLWDTPAIRHIVQIGYAIRRFGYKAMVEKFLPWFDNNFFGERCRQFSSFLAHIERKRLREEPELIGLAILVLCSDMLILSHSSYPDDFVADILEDLHERAKDIAGRTRANAVQQSVAALRVPSKGVPLGTQPELMAIKEQKKGTIHVNVGRGIPGIIAIIAAGGRSTRVQSIIPKPVIKLHDKYLVEHVIDSLRGAFGDEVLIFLNVGWESELIRGCLGNHYRYLNMSPGYNGRTGHRGLGPAARLYASLLGIETFDGPIIACYSDMPLVSSQSIKRLHDEFEDGQYSLCFLTTDNAPLPGHVIRNADGQIERVVHDRHRLIDGSPERDVGFYIFRNTLQIQEALGDITNANIKQEYGIHQLIGSLVKRGKPIGTAKIPADECWTVNNAADLFWLAMRFHQNPDGTSTPRDYYDMFKRDYGVTFDYNWFAERRAMLRLIFDPSQKMARPVPLHFLTEFQE
jgi:molybdopterin-guanine dinucleotide biosynthesis protein A